MRDVADQHETAASQRCLTEEHEIDKRLQLEGRVSANEKHLGLDKKIVA
jgi:hypothetical protein